VRVARGSRTPQSTLKEDDESLATTQIDAVSAHAKVKAKKLETSFDGVYHHVRVVTCPHGRRFLGQHWQVGPQPGLLHTVRVRYGLHLICMCCMLTRAG
jgi:hypothetical protein